MQAFRLHHLGALRLIPPSEDVALCQIHVTSRPAVGRRAELETLLLRFQCAGDTDIGAQQMNKLVTLSRLMCLATALAGPALMATPDVVNAKRLGQHGGSSHVRQGNSHPANITKRNGIKPHFVISGQNADVKRVLRHRKEKSHEADCKTNCYKPTQTTTKKTSQPTTAGTASPTVSPNGTNGTATISNGVTTSAIFNGNGLTVSSTSPGRITVINSSNSSVSLAGGSLTLSGATSVKAGPGVDVVRLPNGTVGIAIKPASARLTPPTKGGDPSAVPVVVETLKGQEVFFRTVGTYPAASVGVAVAATSPATAIVGTIKNKDPVTGPIKQTIETFGDLATDVGKEVSSWW
jgi:hypothetical protein